MSEKGRVTVGWSVICVGFLWSSRFSEHRCKSVTGFPVVAIPPNPQSAAYTVIGSGGDITGDDCFIMAPRPFHHRCPVSIKHNGTRNVGISIIKVYFAAWVRS